MEIRKNIPIKDVTNLMRKKTKRPIIVQEVDSDNDIQPRDAELEFENINLNFEKYCYLCHKEINFFSENHPFFQCMTCSKYFHRECYKEYKLKQTEKDLCKNIIRINKINDGLNIYEKKSIENNNKKNMIIGKECILCVMQNNYYCIICKKEYYTKLREIKKESQAYIFPIAYEKYHCPYLGCEEKIKCNKCKSDLYVDIHLDKNRGKINEVFCEKCKSTYNSTNINNICLNCKSNFKSDIKIYNFFPSIKIDLITVVHCLFDRKFALPLIMENKICRCDLSKIEMIRHNDGGDLL